MKKILALLLMFILVAGLVACAPKEETLADYGVPEDFNILFEFGFQGRNKALNILDTYNSRIQKDLVTSDGQVAETELYLSAAEKAEIYQKIVEYDLFSMTEEMTIASFWDPNSDIQPGMSKPTETYHIRFTVDGKTYGILGDSSLEGRDRWDNDKGYTGGEEVENFNKFNEFIKEFYYARSEYKALPEKIGIGYL